MTLRRLRLHRVSRRRKTSRAKWVWFLVVVTGGVCGLILFKGKKPGPSPELPVRTNSAVPRINANPVVSANSLTVLTTTVPPTDSVSRPRPAPIESTSLPRPAQNVFEAQLILDRLGISSGSIDGVIGPQTRAALRAFQEAAGLPGSGELDLTTKTSLVLDHPPVISYVVSSNDIARLQPLSKTWLGKSRQTALDYETVLERVSERGHAHPNLVRQLNPGIDWTNIVAGTVVQIPDADFSGELMKAAFAKISLSGKTLEAFDAETNLLAHFPCSVAQRVEKRPAGELHVEKVAENPNYAFDPEVFPESAEARQLNRKLILPPGPNNPVGVAWIGLDKPGYGIHGTPSPEQVGRTESHGCFRLANWNAALLVKMVWIGMPVFIEP